MQIYGNTKLAIIESINITNFVCLPKTCISHYRLSLLTEEWPAPQMGTCVPKVLKNPDLGIPILWSSTGASTGT